MFFIQDYKNKIELLTTEMRDKEGEFNVQMEKKCCEVETKCGFHSLLADMY